MFIPREPQTCQNIRLFDKPSDKSRSVFCYNEETRFLRRIGMNISYSMLNRCLIVNLSGEIDEYAAGYLRPNLDKLFSEQDMAKVIFDLSQVTFMDSTGIGLMIGRYKQLKSRGIPVFILNPSSTADKIFTMARLYELMPKTSNYIEE